MFESIMICAGIVLFNPNVERLRENIAAIMPQVTCIIVVDNNSSKNSSLESLISAFDSKIIYIKNDKNVGVAHALNQILGHGQAIGADWVLTLDQDSVCPSDIIIKLNRYTDIEKAGIISPVINDRNSGIIDVDSSSPYNIVDSCITSASLTKVEVWRKVGGFDTTMFIDGVDTDFCLTLREHGYKIIQCTTVELLHELGHNSKKVSLFGHQSLIFNHSPLRYYYISRNIIYNNRKHRRLRPSPIRGLVTVAYRWLLIIIFEREKWGKTISLVKGAIDGFKVPIARR